jgi:hypothetical protein
MTGYDESEGEGISPQPDQAGSASKAKPDRGYRRDLRHYASQTSVRLAVGMLILLLTVGNGLVYWIYGKGALLSSLTCMLAFAVPVVLIASLLWLLGWVARRGRND